MKIYTRHGDGGETGIWGGLRLAEDEARLEAIGTVDELNAAIGFAGTADVIWAPRAVTMEG